MDNELKPCPFCGESEQLATNRPNTFFADSYIHCYSCGAKGSTQMPPAHIKAWNTRAPTDIAKPDIKITMESPEAIRARYDSECG